MTSVPSLYPVEGRHDHVGGVGQASGGLLPRRSRRVGSDGNCRRRQIGGAGRSRSTTRQGFITDLAVTLALGGDCIADIALLRAERGSTGWWRPTRQSRGPCDAHSVVSSCASSRGSPSVSRRRGVRHRLAVIPAVGLRCGARRGGIVLRYRGLGCRRRRGCVTDLGGGGGRRPSEATIRRALGRVGGGSLLGSLLQLVRPTVERPARSKLYVLVGTFVVSTVGWLLLPLLAPRLPRAPSPSCRTSRTTRSSSSATWRWSSSCTRRASTPRSSSRSVGPGTPQRSAWVPMSGTSPPW